MKKYLFLICILITAPLWGQINIVTSTPNQANLAKQIGGNEVKVEALCTPYSDPHFLSIKPTYMRKLHHAQIFIETGMEAEPWVVPLVEGARNSKIQTGKKGRINASQGITPLEIPQVVSRDRGDVHAQGNPHYLLDPVNSKFITAYIYKALVNTAPNKEAFFKKNLVSYRKKLRIFLIKWLKIMRPYRNKIQVVSYHRLWPYFTRRFGLKYIGTIEEKPGVSPSSSHLQSLITQMKANNCRIILVAKWYNRKTADYVASKTNAKVLHLPIQTGEGINSYLDLFDKMLTKIVAVHKNN